MLGRADFGHRRHHLGKPLGRAGGLADFAPNLGKFGQRARREQRVENELAEATAGHLACDDGGCAIPENAGDAGDRQEYRNSGQRRTRLHPFTRRPEGALDGAAKPVRNSLLVDVGLHRPMRGEIFCRVSRGIAKRILSAAR